MFSSKSFLSQLQQSRGFRAVCFVVHLLLFNTLAVATAPTVPDDKPDDYPAWWFSQGLIPQVTNATSPSWQNGDYLAPDDYAIANIGQLKQIATVAAAEMNADLPGGAGSVINNLVTQWSSASDPNTTRDDYAALTLGQLKAVVQPFYDRLIAIGYINAYPWTGLVADDFSIANLGQVKYIFSFDLTYSTTGSNVPDWWMLAAGLDPTDPDGLLLNVANQNITIDGSPIDYRTAFLSGTDPVTAGTSLPGLPPVGGGTEPFTVSVSASGPFQAPATISPGKPFRVVITVKITHPYTTTIQSLVFSDISHGGATLTPVSSDSNQYQFDLSTSGFYRIRATALDSNGATAAATAEFQVNTSNYYVRGGVGVVNQYLSTIIAVDFEKGIALDGVVDFPGKFPAAQFPMFPWFLRTQAEAGEPVKFINSVNSNSGNGVYEQLNYVPYLNTAATGGPPPMVAFGSQAGGSPLYVNQSYNFGVAPGGQIPTIPPQGDIKVEVYEKAVLANGAVKVLPIHTKMISLPRIGDSTWNDFVNNGYVRDYPLNFTPPGKTAIVFDTQVQYVPGTNVADTWGQLVNYPLLVTHKAANSSYYYKVSYLGYTTDQHPYEKPVVGVVDDLPMAVASTGPTATYNVSYTLDFDDPAGWQTGFLTQNHFQGTPLPSPYLGKSIDELLREAPAVSGNLSNPDTTTGITPGGLKLLALNKSPELKTHPVLDQFVDSMKGDPMALANYVINRIDLTDAVGYAAGNTSIQNAINPQGVSRDALATFLEGQGSPAEQCALLIYLLRKAGVPCGYVFPQQNGMLLFDEQLSALLRMQIRGSGDLWSGAPNVPELIPVNYPWVAAYVKIKEPDTWQWVHIFPWLKDTSVTEGDDLWKYMPLGYQTGGQWLRHYLLDDKSIRGLSKDDNPATLFPLYVQNQLKGTQVSLDQLGMNIYNRQNYYTQWSDFPRPWTTPVIGDANLAQSLDVLQNSGLSSALTNIFDTMQLQVTSIRNGTVTEPSIDTGILRLADLHDRRFLLYSQLASGSTSATATYNLILSLESFSSPSHDPYHFSDDPGDYRNAQTASVVLNTSTTDPASNDDVLVCNVTYNRNRQVQAANLIATPLLDPSIEQKITDIRYLRKGDMACLCLDYGRVTQKMQEFQLEKYSKYQQNQAAHPDPEKGVGQLLYLMGQSYYNMVSQFQQNVEKWTKTHAVSWMGHGFSKLSPNRDSHGNPLLAPNGTDIDLHYPRVDMAFERVAVAGNGTSDLNSGDRGTLAGHNAVELMAGEASADEHRVINQFFPGAAAVSTVRLLDIAQGWTPSNPVGLHFGTNSTPGGGRNGVVMLTPLNYKNYDPTLNSNAPKYQVDNKNLTGSNVVSKALPAWAGGPADGSLWSYVKEGLGSGLNPTDAALATVFSTVFITPGPMTATGQRGAQPYAGMAAFVLGDGNYGAYISDQTKVDSGAFGGDCGLFSLSVPPTGFVSLTADGGITFFNRDNPPVDGSNTVPSNIAVNSAPTLTAGIADQTILVTQDVHDSAADYELRYNDFGISSSDLADLIRSRNSSGDTGGGGANNALTSNNSAPIQIGIFEPINSMTGEFYVDATDLKLNGPMPLEIRRTYGSLNQANNNFGYGWRLNYFPYLMFSKEAVFGGTTGLVVTTQPTLIYAAEMDGSVITYRLQSPVGQSTGNKWIPQPLDNPTLSNVSNGVIGGAANLFNNRIDQKTVSGATVYTLTGADGSVRTFPVQKFPVGTGKNGFSRARPYLQTWADNRGNSYSFSFGTEPAATDYGQLKGVTSSNGNYLGFSYDIFGHIVEAYTGDGRRLQYQYDNYGDLVQVTLPDASTILYAYQHPTPAKTPYSTHLIVQETKPDGRLLQNTYDMLRRVKTQSATVGPDEQSVLTATLGYQRTKNTDDGTYSGTTTITDAQKHTSTYTYERSQITKVVSPPQNNAPVLQTPDPTQIATQQWYQQSDSNTDGYYAHSLKNSTDKRGLTKSYKYDGKGNLKSVTLSGSSTETTITNMTYNTTALPGSGVVVPNTLKTMTDAVGRKTSYFYTDSAHPFQPTLIKTIAADGQTLVSSVQMTYEDVADSVTGAFGLLNTVTTGAGTGDAALVQYLHGSNGFLISKTEYNKTGQPDPLDSLNVKTNYTYNLRGELVSQTDAVGQKTTYSYDARGNRTAAERFDQWGNEVSWDFTYYNQNGEIEWAQGPRYNPSDYVTRQYDAGGRLKEEVKWLSAAFADGSGVASNGYAATFYSHDTLGNLSKIDDPNGNSTTMTYDALSEIMGRNVYTGGAVGQSVASESFTYEPGGEIATHTTLFGGTERRYYTQTGLLKQVIGADQSSKTYLYDKLGRQTQETLPNGSSWVITYGDADTMNSSLTVKRSFYKAGGSTLLAAETQTFDVRGNVISKTDLGLNTFLTTYDGLNRVKSLTGPAATTYPGSVSTQQTTTHVYDAAGQIHTVQNATGEHTDTYLDALGRPTLVSVFNAGGSVASHTGYWYSPDHQCVTTMVGSGATAVSTTEYTDTMGRPLLLKYADGKYKEWAYDRNGNVAASRDELGAITSWKYDGLNEPISETLPASPGATAATTTFVYSYSLHAGSDPITSTVAGKKVVRTLPGTPTLAETTFYNTAGRKSSEHTDSSLATTPSRTYSYTYDQTTGLLTTINDPRNIIFTTTYNEWLRPLTVNTVGPNWQQNQNTTYGYDIRGMVNSITQGYADPSVGASTLVARNYDAYGHIYQETVSMDPSGGTNFGGNIVSQWNQSWDAAGRRSVLSLQGGGTESQYGYTYYGNGLLSTVTNAGETYSYFYDDNGLLNKRQSSWRTLTIPAGGRDSRGRITTQTSNSGLTTLLSETMSWNDDNRLKEYDVINSSTVAIQETRPYTYEPVGGRGRLLGESFEPSVQTYDYAQYAFDQAGNPLAGSPSSEGGRGLRTAQTGGSFSNQVVHQDGFARVTDEQGAFNEYTIGYDDAGNVNTLNGGTLTWDAFGRLVKVVNAAKTESWTTVYDGLGRRIETDTTLTSAMTPSLSTPFKYTNNGVTDYIHQLKYYYDPQVEFLELGLFVDYTAGTSTQWKVYGPDVSGIYGGAQGTGGLEAIVGPSGPTAKLNNYFGDVVAEDPYGDSTWNPITTSSGDAIPLGGYGPMPGANIGQLKAEWRGHYIDQTGLIYMGARYYEPSSGRFVSPDPAGLDSDMSLYAYCNGDPVNGLDPDGRISIFEAMFPAHSGRDDLVKYAREGGLYAAYGIINTPAAVLANPRVQGGLKVVGGGGEIFIGGIGLATTSPTILGAGVSGAAVLHGMDDVQAGVRQWSSNTSIPSFTATGITALTGSPQIGELGDATLGVALSLGSGLLTQGASVGANGGRVTQLFNPALGSFGPGAETALSAQVTLGGRIMDGASVAQTWVAPAAVQDMNWLQRFATGVGSRTNYVEFDAGAGELSNPGGAKWLLSPWQQVMAGDIELSSRNAEWGQLGGNNGQTGFLWQLGSAVGRHFGSQCGN